MHARTVGALAAIGATLALAFAVGSASARNFSISNQNFRITWTEMKFFDQGGANLFTLCPVTMEGSFHYRTIIKAVDRLIGYITRAVVNEAACRESLGIAAAPSRFLQETLPWHITYAGFTGALPDILSMRVRVHDVSYEDTLANNRCLFRGEETPLNAIFALGAAGVISTFEFERGTTLPPLPGFCEEANPRIRGGLERPGPVTLLGASTRITLTLI